MSCYATLPLFLGLVAVSALVADEQPARGGGRPATAAKKSGTAGNAGNPSRDQVQKFLDMTPEDREEFLKDLPPARRQNLQKRLNDVEKMAPARRTRVLTRLEMLNSLPPQKRQQVRRAIGQFDLLPPDRKLAIGRELRLMAPMLEEDRRAHMNSEEFRNRYSIVEQQMMSNLSEVTPAP